MKVEGVNINRVDPEPDNPKWIILTNLLSEELNATQLSDRMDIGVSAIRNHLENLEQKGYIEHFFQRASKGRPKKMYKLTEKGSELFPRLSEKVARRILDIIERKFGKEKMKEIICELAGELGEELKKKSGVGRGDVVTSIKSALDEWGFHPEVKKHDGGYKIENKNCVFPTVAEKFSACFCGGMIDLATPSDVSIDDSNTECSSKGLDCCLQISIDEEMD